MAIALVPLVVTLTFGVPQGAYRIDPQGDVTNCVSSDIPPGGPDMEPSVRRFVRPLDSEPNAPPPGSAPRWPSDLRVGIEQNDWVVVFVGARFFRSHFIRVELHDARGGTERRFRLIDDNGWIAFRPGQPLRANHTYFLTMTLLDEFGRESASHPTIGFIMPTDVQRGGTLVLTAQGDPPVPGLWQPTFVEKLLFFIVDPFVLAFVATAAFLRRRRRRHLEAFLAA